MDRWYSLKKISWTFLSQKQLSKITTVSDKHNFKNVSFMKEDYLHFTLRHEYEASLLIFCTAKINEKIVDIRSFLRKIEQQMSGP